MLARFARAANARSQRHRCAPGGKAVGVFLVCLLGFLAGAGPALATGYTWNSDSAGDWYDSSKWGLNGIPTGYGTFAEIARSPMAVETGNSLVITAPRGELYFGKSAETPQPSLVNNGVIGVSD